MKSPPMQEMWVGSLGWEHSLEEEMATCFSILAWKIPWTEEPSGLQSMGMQESGTTEQLSTHRHTHTHTHIKVSSQRGGSSVSRNGCGPSLYLQEFTCPPSPKSTRKLILMTLQELTLMIHSLPFREHLKH